MGESLSVGGWRLATASVVGTSHQRSGGSCQDAHSSVVLDLCGEKVLVAMVSDGAGSAECGGEGAAFVCARMQEQIVTWLHTGHTVGELSRDFVIFLIECCRNELAEHASQMGRGLRDFACTLVGAVVAHDVAAFMQIGDGCIVIRPAGETDHQWVFWPDRGEYENTTYFVTSFDAINHLSFTVANGMLIELAIFSDGLQRLALDLNLQIPYAGFFKGIFEPLASFSDDSPTDLSASLAAFLASDRINNRTDDDKTLILASRNIY